jgi:hypothetical protein
VTFSNGVGGGLNITHTPGKGWSGGFEIGIGKGFGVEFNPKAEAMQGDPLWTSQGTFFAEAEGQLGPNRLSARVEWNKVPEYPGTFGNYEPKGKLCLGPVCFDGKGCSGRLDPAKGIGENLFLQEVGGGIEGKAGVKVLFPIWNP